MRPSECLLLETDTLNRVARVALRSDLLRAAGHINEAWRRTIDAEREGGDEVAVRGARVQLLQTSMTEWVPLAAQHAAMLEDEEQQREWCQDVINTLRTGRAWFDQEKRLGNIVSPLLDDARAVWDEMIEGCELLIGAARA